MDNSNLDVCIPNGQNSCTEYSCAYRSNFIQTDPEGGRHALGIQYGVPGIGGAGACGVFALGTDRLNGGDERYKASADPNTHLLTVWDLHGNSPSQTDMLLQEDVNGNYRDTTGRTAPLPSPYTTQTQVLTYTSALNINIINTIGVQLTGCQITSIPPGVGSSFTAVRSLTLPNGQQFVFQYDPIYQFLKKIIYPTGAAVTYTWNTIPNAEGVQYKPQQEDALAVGRICALRHDWFAITKRVVSFDGVTDAQEQDFSYTTVWPTPLDYKWTSKSTTVTTKDLLRGTQFQTVYNYSPMLPPPSNNSYWADLGYMPVENTIVYKDTDGSLLKTVNKKWNNINQLAEECETLPNGQTSGKFYQYQTYNPTGWFAGFLAGTATHLTTDVAEYDYGTVSNSCVQPTTLPIRETVTTYQAFGNTPLVPNWPTLLDRPASVKVYGVVNAVKTLMEETDYAYDATTPVNVSPAPFGHDETHYGSSSTAPRGNPTTVTRKCFVGATACTDSVTKYAYDTTGQVLSSTDANLNTTTYSYADNYTTDDGSPTQNTNAYVTKITQPTTNSVAHVAMFKYGFNDGRLRSKTDENSQTTTFCYWTGGCSGATFDPFVRLTGIQNPSPYNGVNKFTYSDAGPNPSVTATKAITSTLSEVSTTTYDAIGHPVQTALTSDPDGVTYTATTYDGMGRPRFSYNPTRCTTPTTNCGTEPTWGFSTVTYDAFGRTVNVAKQDGSSAQTSYSSNQTTVTDEAGKKRTTQTDALGRLAKVWEAPAGLNYETDYQYDTLGNLLRVDQMGGSTNSANWRTRTFIYNSLSRLLTAANPESGTIGYTYDADGNVLTKTAPKPNQTGTATVITTYQYDFLNRLIKKSYNDGSTAAANYVYDGSAAPSGCTLPTLTASNPVGRRTGRCDGSGATTWNYDTMGRALNEARKITAPTTVIKTTTYSYNFDGSLWQLTYPSGNTVTYTPSSSGTNSVGRTGSAIDLVNNANYVMNAKYAPQGTLTDTTFGSVSGGFAGIKGKFSYSNRLQPIQMVYTTGALPTDAQLASPVCPPTIGTLMHRTYNFANGSTDNGNVIGISNCITTARSQNFDYDSLNRIADAYTTGTNWGEALTIDAWGNLTNRASFNGKPNLEPLNVAPATAQNRLTGFVYDAAGNMTGNNPFSFTYDAENRLKSVTNGATWTYLYDGDGSRVMKSTAGSIGKLYWTGTGSDPLSEQSLSMVGVTFTADYIFFNGERVARRDLSGTPSIHYYYADHLGSASVVTDAVGTFATREESDYYPFGGESVIADNDPNNYKFTGKERDTESNLDNFGARYDASSLGRFMTPDPLPWIDWQHGNREERAKFADFISNPQNLNMYSYVDNDPENKTDPTGMEGCNAGDKTFSTCTIKIVYDPKTSKGTLTVTGQNKGDKDPTTLLTSSVVVGGNGHVTPTGTFTATVWEKDHVSTKYGSAADTPYSKTALGGNAFGPYQLHIKELDSRGIYIHGTMGPSWSPVTWGNSIFLSPTSHGCVRMCNADDVKLHNMMPNPSGNKVIISAEPED